MVKAKTDMKALDAEDAAREVEKNALKIPVTILETDKAKKNAAGRGRPVSRPESKLVSYNLPLELISRIDAEATRVCGRNKSAMVERAFEVYFASIAKSE